MTPEKAGLGRFALRVVVAIALGALALLIWRLHDVLLLVFAAILVATILHAAADLLCRVLPFPKWVALLLAGLLIIGFVGGAVLLFGQEVGGQLSELGNTLPVAWQGFVNWVGEDRVNSALSEITPDGSTVAGIAQSVFGVVTSALSGLVLAILGGIYFAADPRNYFKGALLLLPEAARPRADEAGRETARALRNWLLGQIVSMVATSVAVFAGLTLIGVPSALALALIAGLFEFIPLVGPFLGAVPAVLIALTAGVETFALTIGFFIVWQQIEGNAMAPIVMRYAVEIPPAVTLFALFLFGGLFGAIGVLLGGPLTVTAWVLIRTLWVNDKDVEEAK